MTTHRIAGEDPVRRRVLVQGFPIAIEYPAGSTKLGEDDEGKKWARVYLLDYGFIDGGPLGGDGEVIDVYLGPHHGASYVYIVNQLKKDGTFDETKVMMGFNSLEEATQGYLRHYPAGWEKDRVQSVKPMSLMEFRKWLSGPGVMKAAKLKTAAPKVFPNAPETVVHTQGSAHVEITEGDAFLGAQVVPQNKQAIVSIIFVPEGQRNQGVGTRLMEALATWCREQGIEFITGREADDVGRPGKIREKLQNAETFRLTKLHGEKTPASQLIAATAPGMQKLLEGYAVDPTGDVLVTKLAEPTGDTYQFKQARVIQEVQQILASDHQAALKPVEALLEQSPTWRQASSLPPRARQTLLKHAVLAVDSWLAAVKS